MATVSIISIPHMRQFAQNQELKSTIKEVKSLIRTANNKAINGVKNSSDERVPWGVSISGSATTQSFYELAGCSFTLSFNGCRSNEYSYEKKNVPSLLKMEACILPCTGASYTTDVILYFLPIEGLLRVYSAPNSVPSVSTYLGNSIGIKIYVVSNPTNDYLISINEKGSITESEI